MFDDESDGRIRRRPRKPRRTWDRDPVQRPHSSKKGIKGYDRHRQKEDMRRYLEEIDSEDLDDQDIVEEDK